MEVDLTKEGGETEEQQPAVPLSLNLLSTIKTAQAQNGLRHGDYMRYRKHCASKLQSLYKVLKMQHGRTKYVKRKLDVPNVTDVRHLQVPLFSAERAWSQAMELKKEAEVRGSAGAADPRKRQHLIRRLSKAVLWATELARFAAERADTRGALEAEAYCSWMAGQLMLERESDWEAALAKFSRAKKLWQELAKACPDLEGQSLCLAQVEEMEPNIRYCNYRISRAGGAVPADPAELMALGGGGDTGALPGLDLLQSKLAALAQEAQVAQAAATSYFEWMGARHPVRNERVKLALHQAGEFGTQADQAAAEQAAAATASASGAATAMDTGAGDALDARLALYDKAINALAEAKSHVRNAVKGLAGPDAEAHFKELEALEVAVEGARLQRTVERAQAHLEHTRARFAAGLQRLALGKKIKDKERHARPEEVVRVLDLLGRHLEDLADLGARLGGRAGEALHEAAAARATAARAMRVYHVAHALLAAAPAAGSDAAAAAPSSSGPSKALESYALFSRAQQRAAEAAESLKGLAGGDAAAGVLLKGREALLAELAELGRQAAAYKAVAQAELAAADLKAREEVASGVGGMSLTAEQQQQQQQQQQQYLLDNLDKWESFAGGAAATAAAGAAKAPPRLYNAPYEYGAIAVRPIMLDTASNCLAYPSLEHRLRKPEKKSVLSSLFSWRR
ncbi:hypothetical protein CHLRE_06g267100v5 [Chlamydomonas reinhardtii]|uniref:Signal recognition particle subunit SRP68 n=1 Tax=Chlamydomonas reinhardtii TaxID=3055 RepID=A0A2K3DN40_CHLRE|nr:uncharacterized protein CHLRE_06g267100v5 [Chlamydomonas reinhardtii]PNW81938.1 hypothetical protein CHLRE_06g267100v5 [Chlamydomonas reinhardtii]